MLQTTESITEFEKALHTARPRIVRWMISLTHDPQAAEDVAQDTLLIAWEKRADLTNPDGIDAWLNAIAHNVYKRWARAQGKAYQRTADLDETVIAGSNSVEHELEREELADLLDTAIEMLPAQTREMLIAHYLEGLPQAKVAQLLGTTENAVAVRLHRGKLAMREAIDTDHNKGWKSTRIWCPTCGNNHYESQFNPDTGDFILRCPACDQGNHPDLSSWSHNELPELPVVKGLKSIKPALNRVMAWLHDDLNTVLASGWYHCHECSQPIKIEQGMPPEVPPPHRNNPGIHYRCQHCGTLGYTALSGIAISTPQGRQFWKDHERIRSMGVQHIEEHAGRPALMLSSASVRQPDQRFEVIFAEDNYEILSINGEPYNASEDQ